MRHTRREKRTVAADPPPVGRSRPGTGAADPPPVGRSRPGTGAAILVWKFNKHCNAGRHIGAPINQRADPWRYRGVNNPRVLSLIIRMLTW